ncbi:MAG: 2-C-methyl-D-erythritol 4-phosphate cytidylyltransferase [Planctomycetia bacterium]|nr:2-C-methyl-D-erythritol 4-phosphate cytidylyltransferase [Planctomycetia bacterium]
MKQTAVIIVAAGRSERFSGQASPLAHSVLKKKPFALLKGRAVWLHSAQKFANRNDVCQLILVVSPEDRDEVERKYAADLGFLGVTLADGGRERADSVANGLACVNAAAEYVAVHDAARPCVTDSELEKVFREAYRTDAAILATPLVGTIKRAVVADNTTPSHTQKENPFAALFEEKNNYPSIETTIDRNNLWEAQTPQVFKRSLLEQAYANRKNTHPTDDSQLVEWLGHPVSLVQGEKTNLKITTAADLKLAEKFLDSASKKPSPFHF